MVQFCLGEEKLGGLVERGTDPSPDVSTALFNLTAQAN
jgi:hypothetical protein